MDDDGLGDEPNCDRCGTVMHAADGGYICRGCGWFFDMPWIERPRTGDDLPGIHGG